MNEKKKSLILTIIAVVTLIVFCGVATFAYFVSQGGNDVTKNINVTKNTTDRLKFTIGSDISLTANQEDFGQGMGNKSGSTTASAILVANNSTNTATEHYYLYLNIINNNFEYTTAEETAELILTITDPQGQKLTELNGYKYVTVGDVSGFDITTKNGLITIADNYEITSTNTTIGETQEWGITITFANLDSDQNANTGKTFNGNLIIQKNPVAYHEICNETTFACQVAKTYTDGSNGLYYHDGSMISTQGICTYDGNEVFALTGSGREQATNETDCNRIFSATFDGMTEYYDASIITVGVPAGMVDEVNWNSSSGICETKTSKIPVYSETNGGTGVPASQSECNGYGAMVDDSALLFEEMGSGTFGQVTVTIDANDNSYRYAGANPNNYVCFGSDDASCPSDNLYRIIGVFDSEVKLIKSTSYGNYAWDSVDYVSDNTWSTSDMKTTLNTTYYNTLSATWQNKIATHTWKVGGMEYRDTNTAKQYYDTEVGSSSSSTTDSMKIGLMYVSDYGFAASADYWTTALHGYYDSTLRSTNWLYLGTNEWTISPYSSSTSVFSLFHYGNLDVNHASTVYSARPVFYLNSNVTYVSGNGTESNPYRIS